LTSFNVVVREGSIPEKLFFSSFLSFVFSLQSVKQLNMPSLLSQRAYNDESNGILLSSAGTLPVKLFSERDLGEPFLICSQISYDNLKTLTGRLKKSVVHIQVG
jgi:hypothetical protein